MPKRYNESIFEKTFPQLEEDTLRFWREDQTFEKSVAMRPANRQFVIYDGPPFATGLPHYGHILAHVIKDAIPRYQTMKGRRVERRFGWDCHGLPVECIVEQELGVSGKQDIEKRFGIGPFNEKCRSVVLRYSREWEKTEERIGRWVDMKNDYKTMDRGFMESVWHVFKVLFDRGLIYEGYKSMHVCPRCVTPLSNFEINEGYKDVADHSTTTIYPLVDDPKTALLAWTTTTWTLPGNLLLAVGSQIRYAKVVSGDMTYIVAERLVEQVFAGRDHKIVDVVAGVQLVGLRYQPLFPYFADQYNGDAFRVVEAGFVSTEDGTGIVHIAPGFGQEDYEIGEREGIVPLCHLTMDGRFIDAVADWPGEEVKPADDPTRTDKTIARKLRVMRRLFSEHEITHSYPHCWRCDSPLINFPTSSWFVAVEKFKDQLVANNMKVTWAPEHVGTKRFHNWLSNARDWCISRNRFWGTPLPIWKCEETAEVICVGSVAELEKLCGQSVPDLHRHFTDNLEIRRDGKVFRRIDAVLDCWFESGAMPYAQEHYPFESGEDVARFFPADFVAEGLDQTRGWFYTLMVLATALFDKPAFRSVIVNGILLGEDGKKMSKRLRNYPDPHYVLDTHGADALRFYLLSCKATRAEDASVAEDEIRKVVQGVILRLWNSFKFFVTYANIDGFEHNVAFDLLTVESPLDKWIVYRTSEMNRIVDAALQGLNLIKACQEVDRFVDDLSRWYLRNSRRRFWADGMRPDKRAAHEVLYHCLETVALCMAPLMPFLAEVIYRTLTNRQSVHLADWPKPLPVDGFEAEFRGMALVRDLTTVAHRLRKNAGIRTRQPLTRFVVDCCLERDLQPYVDLLQQEINVRAIEYGSRDSYMAPKVRLELGKVGPKYGKLVGTLKKCVEQGEFQLRDGKVIVRNVVLEPDEFQVSYGGRNGYAAAADGSLWAALDLTISDELRAEGIRRDLIRVIQNMRKVAGYDVSDHIRVGFHGEELHGVVRGDEEAIQHETLSTVEYRLLPSSDLVQLVAIEGIEGQIAIGK